MDAGGDAAVEEDVWGMKMEEDLELNRLIKDALESPGAFAVKSPLVPDARRRRLRWLPAVAALSAAALAIVVAWPLVRGEGASRTLAAPSSVCSEPGFSAGEAHLAEAIGLLCEADEVELAEGCDGSAAELLLAWQDAPFAEWL